MKTWRDNADRLIGRACFEAWRSANAGKRRHVPYRVPDIAQELVECLRDDDEHRAKAIFLSYDGLALLT